MYKSFWLQNAMLWCIYANINSYLIICKSPLDWSILLEKKNMYDWKKTRLQLLDYARAEHPATDFIHFHLFCPFTHQATANVYFWPQGVEVKLFTKDYLNKRTSFTRLQMITSLPQETQHTELCKSKQWRNILYSKSKRTLGKCSYWGHECKLMWGMLFLTKTQKTLSLTMKTQ